MLKQGDNSIVQRNNRPHKKWKEKTVKEKWRRLEEYMKH